MNTKALIDKEFVLNPNSLIIPVEDLSLEVFSKINAKPGEFAITNAKSRVPSKIVSAEVASFLKSFSQPEKLTKAILQLCKERKQNSAIVIEDIWPVVSNLMLADILILPSNNDELSTDPKFKAGEMFSTWEILRCVQTLEDSEVYKVKSSDGKFAFLKIGLPPVSRNAYKRFKNEALILENIKADISPKLYEHGVIEDCPYIIGEWIEGKTANKAAEEMYDSGAAFQRVADLCARIAETYSILHSNGIVHGDIHAKNILVSEKRLSLIDFGHARSVNEEKVNSRAGIAFYFDPQLAQAIKKKEKKPQASFQSDQYSLAALLHFLLTGKHYFDFSIDKETMMSQIIECVPDLLADFESADKLRLVFSRALEKSPDKRYPTVGDFAKDFRAALENTTLVKTSREYSTNKSESFVEQMLDRISSLDRLTIRTEHLEPPLCSLQIGSTGIAYSLLKLSINRSEPRILSLADLWISHAYRHMQSKESFHSDKIGITEKLTGKTSLFHSECGVHFVRSLISLALFDSNDSQMSITNFISSANQNHSSLDATLGMSSLLIGTSVLFAAAERDTWVDQADLEVFGNKLFEDIFQQCFSNNRSSLRDKLNLGFAHGWAGVLYALLNWCETVKTEPPEAIVKKLDWLIDQAIKDGDKMRWEWKSNLKSSTVRFMDGWCNGNAGYVFLWLKAHKILDDQKYLNIAKRTGYDITSSTNAGIDLCCGQAGKGYACLALYKATSANQWFELAQELLESGLQVSGRSVTGGSSFFKGELGLALLASDMKNPLLAEMPLIGF